MKTNLVVRSSPRALLVASLAGFLFTALSAGAVVVTLQDSIVSLATNTTKYYTFKDPGSGESVIVSVTVKPISGAGDPFTVVAGGTRLGIGAAGLPGANAIGTGEGVDFTASLVFGSAGVTPGSIRFRLGGLGMVGAPNANLIWGSPATPTFTLPLVGAEMVYALDAASVTLVPGAAYTGQLRHAAPPPPVSAYQLSDAGPIGGLGLVIGAEFATSSVDPHVHSWLTSNANRYARIYPDNAAKSSGSAVTTWMRGSLKQSLPAYAGVQEIYSSTDWVYIRSTGLGSHVMGPWYHGATLLPNVPVNQKSLWRFPRAPLIPTTRTNTPASTIGYFVDGVAIFDPWSGDYYDSAAGGDTKGSAPGRYWNVNAYESEKQTFDASLGHPEASGIEHVHSNPLATRQQVGDHVDFSGGSYSESSTPVTRHSPIIGWMADGFPLYGPYGYAAAMDPASGIRRMTNGFWVRDGTHGTTDVTSPGGRSSRPLWVQRLFTPGKGTTTGPNVGGTYPLGHYIEDYDYLGDHGFLQGVHFDLDQFNGRWCVTPEFPLGTYAYFISIDAAGQPAFPYIIGRAFYGTPAGGATNELPATVSTLFDSMASLRPHLETPVFSHPAGGTPEVTLTWTRAIEGGKYIIRTSGDLNTWSWLPSTVIATDTQVSFNYPVPAAALNQQMYQVALGWLNHFDAATGLPTPGVDVGIRSVSPSSMLAGLVVTLDIEVDPAKAPAGPPLMARLEKLPGASVPAYSATRMGNIVTAEFSLVGLAPGTYDVVVDFGEFVAPALRRQGGFIVR